ncbi:hypothetical protein CYLTODRAFT_252877 [Cylindrobasidium torrendii FP15055 ss-10]|uniref:MULE transposase domain-containing protein n=1 Tax=Cylindrobasidium torrendii FP15055 ss-10 TaxID=1314674 RepID=A0A0D7BEU7_9AGAR|nr:hypothetical protein CYLTODRAFT_252877 [Cylindrobasidium torrendii FP15055 ss-10]
MDRHDCGGWLRISIHDERVNEARIRLSHRHHKPYVSISMTPEQLKTVYDMRNQSPSKIWDYILQHDPNTELTEKQVQAEWTRINQDHWRLDTDQVKSATMLLERLEGADVEVFPITPRENASAIAFGFKEVLTGLGETVEEVLMDSTWKTNALGYELYSIVAEMNGQAVPLAFMFVTLLESAQEGTKGALLRQFIQAITHHCPNIMFTLSDKDILEIDGFRIEIPNAKHQLCYWHGIKYIEKRLGENRPPAAYDPRIAHAVFDFVDPTWAPGVTMSWLEDGVHPDDAEISEPPETLKIKINLATLTAEAISIPRVKTVSISFFPFGT